MGGGKEGKGREGKGREGGSSLEQGLLLPGLGRGLGGVGQ